MKLGALREYATDHAGSAADATAQREITRWINAALRLCAESHEWSFLRDVVSVPLTVGVAGVYLAVTQDSDEFTLDAAQSEVFLQTWVDQERILLVEDDPNQHFTLSAVIEPRRARLASGLMWTADSATGVSYTVVRSLYDLPALTREVKEARLASSRAVVAAMTATDFDNHKLNQMSQTGSPLYYTVRGDSIEVWPPLPAGDGDVLQLVRVRSPATVSVTSPNTTDLDWPDALEDVLQKAVDVEIVRTAKSTSRLDPTLTLGAFAEALTRGRARDSVRQERANSFGYCPGPSLAARDRLAAKRSTVLDS